MEDGLAGENKISPISLEEDIFGIIGAVGVFLSPYLIYRLYKNIK